MKTKTKFNQNILSIALKRQEKMQREVGTNWWFNKSRSYRMIKAVYWLSFIALAVINFFVISGVAYWNSRANDSNVSAAQSQFLTVFIVGSIMILASVIIKSKVRKIELLDRRMLISRISWVLVFLPAIFMIISAYNSLILQADFNEYAVVVEGESGDLSSRWLKLVFYHVLPLFALTLTSFLLHLTESSNFKEVNYYYDKIMAKVYEEYVAENPDYTEEMWLEHIDLYKDESEEAIPLKRSKKSKKRKTQEEE